MPKFKTKKTLAKRIRVTKTGKLVKKQTSLGHLKVKRDSSRKSRKKGMTSQTNRGHIKLFKKLLGKQGKNVK